MDDISQEIKDAIEIVKVLVGNEDNWVIIKKEILKTIPPMSRTVFSTRDPKTKKQSLNDFEHKLISYWFEQTGVRLVIK